MALRIVAVAEIVNRYLLTVIREAKDPFKSLKSLNPLKTFKAKSRNDGIVEWCKPEPQSLGASEVSKGQRPPQTRRVNHRDQRLSA